MIQPLNHTLPCIHSGLTTTLENTQHQNNSIMYHKHRKKLVLKNASFCWLLYLLCCVNYYALFVKKTGISLSWLELIKYNVLWVQKEEIRKENFISWMAFFLSACLLESVHLILPLFPVDFTFKKSFLLQNSLCFTTSVESTRHHIKLMYFLEKWVLSGWVRESF